MVDVGATNSADLRNPKKPRQQAACSIMASASFTDSQWLKSLAKIGGVIGSLVRGWIPEMACERFRPLRTYSSLAKLASLNGSGYPMEIWVWRKPDK